MTNFEFSYKDNYYTLFLTYENCNCRWDVPAKLLPEIVDEAVLREWVRENWKEKSLAEK